MSVLPDLASLSLLRDVARLGGIGAAGRAAGVSQQSASERLRALEAHTALPLVQRDPRGSSLTPAGRLLVEWSADLLDRAAEVEAALTALREERSRELHVHASMTTSEHLVPRWLVTLRRESGVVATLRAANSDEVVEACRRGEADLGFVEGPVDLAGLGSRVVGVDELALVAAPDDRWAGRRTPLSAAEVAARPLTSREQGSGTRLVWEQALAAAGQVAVAPEAELTTTAAVLASVAVGSPPAFVSERTASRDLAAGVLVRLRVDGVDLRRVFTAVWVGDSRPPAGPVRDLLGIAGRLGA